MQACRLAASRPAPGALRARLTKTCSSARQRATPRARVVALSTQQVSSSLVQTLQSAEARVEAWVAELSASAAGTASRLRSLVIGALVLVQRAVHWAQLAMLAVALQQQKAAQQQQQQQQQQQLAYVGGGGGSSAAALAMPVQQAPVAVEAAAAAGQVVGLIASATSGAVEQLRHTLCDANAELDSKMRAIERTAGALQSSLMSAATAHSERVRDNPAGGMWKQGASTDALLSEEEALRQAVFAQVFAELSQKGTSDLSFKAAGP